MIVKTIRCFVVVLLSLTVYVNCQTCQGISQYGECSTNSACGCFHLTYVDDTGICGLLGVSCSRLVPCEGLDDVCQNPDSICVRHPRCHNRPVCYPLSMVDRRLCPSITTSNSTNPHAFVISNYSSELTHYSQIYSRSENSTSTHYYEAIQVVVNTTGTYNFTSSSNTDTYGYLYQGSFYPSNPSVNLLAQDDDSAGNSQFKLPVFLQAGVPYTLVVTTFGGRVTGGFSIVATGPGGVTFIPTNNTVEITTETTEIATGTMAFTTAYQQNVVISNYSSALTNDSGAYSRRETSVPSHFYEAIQVIADTTGTYTLTSSSNMDTYGYLYQGSFYPSNPSANLRAQNDDGGDNGQFKLPVFLQAGVPYTLVVTTYREYVTGEFSIVAAGPGAVRFQ